MAGVVNWPVHFFLATSLGLSQDELTFGEVAKQAGYKTAIVGKMNAFFLLHVSLMVRVPGSSN